MKASRILSMEQLILQRGSVSMEELCEHFDVSMNTVRRDVAELLRRGTAEKVYGGVCARRSEHSLTPYEVRRISSEEAKIAVGRRAAELVHDGDVIYIDSGTTTLQMIDFLADRKDITIITNNLEAIIRCLPHENITVIALPGQLRRKTNSLTGSETVSSIRRYNIRTAFLAATGISTHGVTNSSSLEYEIKKAATEIAQEAVLLVDANKFGVTGLMTFAPVNAFDAVVTDKPPAEEYRALLSSAGAELLCAADK